MNEDETVEIAKKALIDELTASKIYFKLSGKVKDPRLSRKLIKIAKMEEEHAKFWIEFLRKRKIDIRGLKENKVKMLIMTSLFRLIGLALTIKLLEIDENEAIETYTYLLEKAKLSENERERIRKILEDELVHEHEFDEEESRFKDFLNHIRDAVLGMNDGLVEVLSVSAGLAGAYGLPFPVAVGGGIVGLAGALSMGIGTYVSVKAQKQVRLGIVSRIMLASKYVAHVFKEKLVTIMLRKGFSKKTVETIVTDAINNKSLLGKIIAEEEYGLKEEFVENPMKSGLYTGMFYIVGAFVPLIPYFAMLPVIYAIPLSFLLATALLSFTGFIIAVSAEVKIKSKIIELVLTGLGSASLTYAIGRIASLLLGIEVS